MTDTLFNSDTFVADNPFASARVKPLFDRPPKSIPAPLYPDAELWTTVCEWLRVVGFIPEPEPMQADESEVVNEGEPTAQEAAWLAEYETRDMALWIALSDWLRVVFGLSEVAACPDPKVLEKMDQWWQ
jgi:hypothetical protein